jgi:hypothetical protein
MGLSVFQRGVCQLLAENRLQSGESYVAEGAALNELLGAPRFSRDIDLFHDTEEALTVSWQADRASLEAGGYAVRVFRERPGFVEAEVLSDDNIVIVQWARDSGDTIALRAALANGQVTFHQGSIRGAMPRLA